MEKQTLTLNRFLNAYSTFILEMILFLLCYTLNLELISFFLCEC